MSDQTPPYEEREPVVDTRKLPHIVDATPVARPHETRALAPAPNAPVEVPAPVREPWNEARILRVGSIVVATGFMVAFVITASRACPLWLAWLPFLVGALPYLGYAGMALSKHLDDESRSRERRERWAHSRLDVVSLQDMNADTERYR